MIKRKSFIPALLVSLTVLLTGAPSSLADDTTVQSCAWTINKTASQTELTLAIGQSASVTYTVTVGATCTTHLSPATVEVDDSFGGDLGFVSIGDPLPVVFTYDRTIGPFSTCGDHIVNNHAVLEDVGNLVIARSFVAVTAHVTCPPPPVSGCTFTQGYYKNHPSALPATMSIGGTTLSREALVTLLKTPVKGNGAISLAHQLIAALANMAGGATAPSGVQAAIAQAQALLAGVFNSAGAATTTLNPAVTSPLTSTLGAFNEGVAAGGPPHC